MILISGQCFTKGFAPGEVIFIRCFIADYTFTDENRTVITAGLLPGAHPFPISPAIGAK